MRCLCQPVLPHPALPCPALPCPARRSPPVGGTTRRHTPPTTRQLQSAGGRVLTWTAHGSLCPVQFKNPSPPSFRSDELHPCPPAFQRRKQTVTHPRGTTRSRHSIGCQRGSQLRAQRWVAMRLSGGRATSTTLSLLRVSCTRCDAMRLLLFSKHTDS